MERLFRDIAKYCVLQFHPLHLNSISEDDPAGDWRDSARDRLPFNSSMRTRLSIWPTCARTLSVIPLSAQTGKID